MCFSYENGRFPAILYFLEILGCLSSYGFLIHLARFAYIFSIILARNNKHTYIFKVWQRIYFLPENAFLGFSPRGAPFRTLRLLLFGRYNLCLPYQSENFIPKYAPQNKIPGNAFSGKKYIRCQTLKY